MGIGAQRSGTTWLGHYLRRHPQVGFSPLKEVRFFDSKYLADLAGIVHSPLQTRLAIRGLARQAVFRPLTAPALAWHLMGIRRHAPNHYRRYMETLLRNRDAAGEISPSYAALPSEAIRHMEALLDRPRYFLSLRNPADRLISELEFTHGTLKAKVEYDPEQPTESVLERAANSRHLDFKGAIGRYGQSADPARLHILFFEDLFAPEKHQGVLDGLCDHLGIAHQPSAIGAPVNASQSFVRDQTDRDAVVHALRPQYEFAAERFSDALPENWRRDLDRL